MKVEREIKRIDGVPPVEGIRSPLSAIFLAGSRLKRLTRFFLRRALAAGKGPFYSQTAREIMAQEFGVSIGLYSYGSCFDPDSFPSGTEIGRYVSVGPRVRVYKANHPIDRISTHAFFFNSDLGFVPETNVVFTKLRIEHDVWLGDSVIITPSCKRIGLGAVVGAGSIVTKDVPDFAIVAGNPARLIKWRFSQEVQDALRESCWWERSVGECAHYLHLFSSAVHVEQLGHPFFEPVQCAADVPEGNASALVG